AVTFTAISLVRIEAAEFFTVDAVHSSEVDFAKSLIYDNAGLVAQSSNEPVGGLPRADVGRRDDVLKHPTLADWMMFVSLGDGVSVAKFAAEDIRLLHPQWGQWGVHIPEDARPRRLLPSFLGGLLADIRLGLPVTYHQEFVRPFISHRLPS